MYYFNKKNPYIILKRENENDIITNIYNTGCVEIVNKKINKELKVYYLAEQELNKLLEKNYLNIK